MIHRQLAERSRKHVQLWLTSRKRCLMLLNGSKPLSYQLLYSRHFCNCLDNGSKHAFYDKVCPHPLPQAIRIMSQQAVMFSGTDKTMITMTDNVLALHVSLFSWRETGSGQSHFGMSGSLSLAALLCLNTWTRHTNILTALRKVFLKLYLIRQK